MPSRSTQAHVEERSREVARLVSEGYSTADVIRHAAENWGVGSRQAENYLKRAKGILREQWEVDRQDFLGELMSRYQTTYRKALEAEQYGAAIGALNAMAKLAKVVE